MQYFAFVNHRYYARGGVLLPHVTETKQWADCLILDRGRSHFTLELNSVIQLMKIEHSGYTMAVTATMQADGLWNAKILIWPITETIKGLREHHEVQGYSNRIEAEHAALQWGRKRLDLYAEK